MSHQVLVTLNFQGCFVPDQSLSCFTSWILWSTSASFDLNSVRTGSFLSVLLSRGAGMTSDPQGLGEGARSLQGALEGSCPCTHLGGRLTSHIFSKPGGILNM